uniref:TLC domain-containing protein n=2 Tax=Caenorhabditis japonica TaxID=281687 RepID=A0A8R1ICC9_CAEJA
MSESSRHLPEYNTPNLLNLLLPHNIIPLAVYSLIFQIARQYVKNKFWLKFDKFKRYRLQNLTICWVHAVVVGVSDMVLMFSHPHEIFHDVIDWYDPIAAQLPLISVAYFFQDAVDMLRYEWSSYTLELLLHHGFTCAALVLPAATGKFTLAAGWALLMEVNRIVRAWRKMLKMERK